VHVLINILVCCSLDWDFINLFIYIIIIIIIIIIKYSLSCPRILFFFCILPCPCLVRHPCACPCFIGCRPGLTTTYIVVFLCFFFYVYLIICCVLNIQRKVWAMLPHNSFLRGCFHAILKTQNSSWCASCKLDVNILRVIFLFCRTYGMCLAN